MGIIYLYICIQNIHDELTNLKKNIIMKWLEFSIEVTNCVVLLPEGSFIATGRQRGLWLLKRLIVLSREIVSIFLVTASSYSGTSGGHSTFEWVSYSWATEDDNVYRLLFRSERRVQLRWQDMETISLHWNYRILRSHRQLQRLWCCMQSLQGYQLRFFLPSAIMFVLFVDQHCLKIETIWSSQKY